MVQYNLYINIIQEILGESSKVISFFLSSFIRFCQLIIYLCIYNFKKLTKKYISHFYHIIITIDRYNIDIEREGIYSKIINFILN